MDSPHYRHGLRTKDLREVGAGIARDVARMRLEVGAGHVQKLLADLQATGRSANTAVRVHATLRRALGQAERWGLVARNVARLVDLHKVEHVEMQPFTPGEARVLLRHLSGHRLEALYAVALAMGLRQGEALGLRWQDIDLDRREMSVRYQLQHRPRGEVVIPLDGNRELVPTKSHRSRLALVIPEAIVDKLRAHRARQARERLLAGDEWRDHGLVFATRKGSPLDGSDQTRRFHDLVVEAGLPPRRFHDMRHSCGTILAAQDVPLSEIMAILGHSNIAVTMRYVHSLPETRRQAASRMNEALFGTGAS